MGDMSADFIFHLKVFLKDKYGKMTVINLSSSCGFKVTQTKPFPGWLSLMHLLHGTMEVGQDCVALSGDYSQVCASMAAIETTCQMSGDINLYQACQASVFPTEYACMIASL